MPDNQENRKTRSPVSNEELTTIESDSERTMRDHASPSFLVDFVQAKLRCKALQGPEEILRAAHESDTEGHPFEPTAKQAPAATVTQSISST